MTVMDVLDRLFHNTQWAVYRGDKLLFSGEADLPYDLAMMEVESISVCFDTLELYVKGE